MDWAFRPAFDLELKQYTLLAYLQRVERRFAERKLFPHIADLECHIEELERVRERKNRLARELGTDLLGFDQQTGAARRQPLVPDEWPAVIDEVIAWALPGLAEARRRGVELLEDICDRITLFPVGLMPLDAKAGWLMLRCGGEARVYAYDVQPLRLPRDEHMERRVRTRYVTTYSVSLASTYQWIKTDLLRSRPELPNPAVFVFESDLSLPTVETFMPLAKQLVYEQVSGRA